MTTEPAGARDGEKVMDEATLTALKGSIAKWEAIVAGTGMDRGNDNCSLCAAFFDNCCKGCPVFANTGCRQCVSTPHEEWARRPTKTNGTGGYDFSADPESLRLAQAELDFLRSLLPPSPAPTPAD